MKKLFIVFVLAMMVGRGGVALACQCEENESPEIEFSNSDIKYRFVIDMVSLK